MFKILIKKKINTKLVLTLIFFITIFLIGLSNFKDFNLYGDEPVHQWIGSIYYQFVKEVILNFNVHNEYLEKILQLSQDDHFRLWTPYPMFFELLTELISDILNFQTSKAVFHLRHFINFFFFFISLIFFFLIINKRFNNYFLSILGVLFIFVSPRIFAESFYNSKDILFLSFLIINIYFSLKFIEKQNVSNLILLSIASGILLNIRVMGLIPIFLVCSIIFFEIIEKEKLYVEKMKKVLIYLFISFLVTFIFWPYLWLNPQTNLSIYLDYVANFSLIFTNLYLGETILSNQTPWHYLFIWIAISIPLSTLLISLFGMLLVFYKFLKNIYSFDDSNELWLDNKERIDFFILILFLIPVLASLIYRHNFDGWRHYYFIFPLIVYFGIYFLVFLKKINLKLFKTLIILIFLNLSYNVLWMIKFHPHQYVYFNFIEKKIIKKKFDLDPWGLSIKSSLEHILKNNQKIEIIKVAGLGNTWIKGTFSILDEKLKKRLKFVEENEADYLINTFRPHIGKRIEIDNSKFSKYHELIIDDKIINSIYKRINK